jgi:hypothetical protein
MTQCTSRPDCPCNFCEPLRAKHFCYRRDREMDTEMRERQKIDPDFVEEQRRLAEEFIRSIQNDESTEVFFEQ